MQHLYTSKKGKEERNVREGREGEKCGMEEQEKGRNS